MTMPWYDLTTRSTCLTRATSFLPDCYQNSTASPLSASSRGRRRGGGGVARGRGRSNQPRSWPRQKRNASRNFDAPEACHNSENFDELEVVKEESLGECIANAYDDTPVETSGLDVPSPVTSFSDIPFCKDLSDNIKRCKFVKPTPIQRYAIPVAMAGRDVMACAQTGSGKTAAFCFPIISGILREKLESPMEAMIRVGGFGCRVAFPLALILTPTRELCCQIHEEVQKFSYHTGVKVAVAYGGAPIVHQIRNLQKDVDILVATPGRLIDMIERAKVCLRNVKYLTLDEADRMLDMGFEPQIRKLVQDMGIPPPGVRQTLLFSATFPTEIQRLASDFLSNYVFLAAGKVGSSTDLIIQKVEYVNDTDKRKHLMDLLRVQRANGNQGKHALTLIFVATKRGVDALNQWLSMKHFPSIAIHGDKVQTEREQALQSFKSGHTPILVATDVAARGLDIPHVAHVINFDLPRDIDDYVHRIGRTGRAGKSGLATAFFSNKNSPMARALVELMQEANQEIPLWLNAYAETYYSSFTNRERRYVGIKFGGRDYRRGGASKDAGSYYDASSKFADASVRNSYAYPSRAFTYCTSHAGFPASVGLAQVL